MRRWVLPSAGYGLCISFSFTVAATLYPIRTDAVAGMSAGIQELQAQGSAKQSMVDRRS